MMWSLTDAMARLSTTLAEDSLSFWTDQDRRGYLDTAQRRVAVITRGVQLTLREPVSNQEAQVNLARAPIGELAEGLRLEGGRVLMAIPMAAANKTDPAWRQRVGTPRWALLDPTRRTLTVAPRPLEDDFVVGSLAVLPKSLQDDGDLLFEGQEQMERYQMATVYLAATYALFKERNTEDAGVFYNLFRDELTDAGINPDDVPSIETLLQPGDSR